MYFKARFAPYLGGSVLEEGVRARGQHAVREAHERAEERLEPDPEPLWWSPTIHKANVYVSFQVQLDLTGIFMCVLFALFCLCGD